MAKGYSAGSKGGGGSIGGGGGIVSTRDIMTEIGAHPTEVDETMQAFKNVYSDYGLVVEEIQVAEMTKANKNVMAYYDGTNIAINETYFDKVKMEAAYDSCVKMGFHPSKGNKTALEAVAAHELGHALTQKAAEKMGVGNLHFAADKIVNQAKKQTGHKGAIKMAGKISGYAKKNSAETIAEAFADVYCNGKGAHAESIAIVNIMNGFVK